MKILIMGAKSFASCGLSLLLEDHHDVDLYTRGKTVRTGKFVYGDVFEINQNPYFKESYDVIINYIFLRGESIEANINYLKTLVDFCKQKSVKRFIQISSLSIYPNSAGLINENSPIDVDPHFKGPYASIKIAADNYLLTLKNVDFIISFIRPGFVFAESHKPSFTGILKVLPFNIAILLGDKKSTLPMIERDVLNCAIAKIINDNVNEPVFIITSKPTKTKYEFVKSNSNFRLIPLPKSLVLMTAILLSFINILKTRHLNQIKALFKTTNFDSSISEKILGLKF